MSAPSAALRLDGSGRLIDGDEAALALNARAGGRVGASLAVPALNDLARAARRLGVPVARSVAAADGAAVWDVDVRARPDGAGVRLLLTGWRQRRPAPPAEPPAHHHALDAEWRWETDAALRLTFVSLSAGERYGFDALALLGRPLTELFAFVPDPDGDLPILSALSERRSFAEQHARIRRAQAEVIASAEVRRDPDGTFLGFAGAARTVEAVPDAPAPLALARPLERALRAPLGRIVADADSLNADGRLSDTYAGYAADIAAAGRHLLALIDDLADLEAVERPDLPLTIETIDLADLARRAGGLLAVRASNAEVAVERPPGEVRVFARGDYRRALQVLINLVGNAVRYSPAGGAVTLTAEAVTGGGRVTVADHGRGIAAEDQARVFDKFERVDPSEPGGTGLGLYIARRLARAMGGDVMLESAPGGGARFSLTLPAAQPAGDQDQR